MNKKSYQHKDGYNVIYDPIDGLYKLEHRLIMEQFLGRKLKTNETVHHKDHNKLNNSIDNLELIENSKHARLHGLEHGRKYVNLKCPNCGRLFSIPKNQSFLQKKNKYNCNCCSKTCRGELYSHIQHYGISEDLKRVIEENFINEYTHFTKQ